MPKEIQVLAIHEIIPEPLFLKWNKELFPLWGTLGTNGIKASSI